MKRILLSLLLIAPLVLAGCAGANDFTDVDDTLNKQEQARANRGIPKPTEMPPGLGDDLPTTAPAVTQPKPR